MYPKMKRLNLIVFTKYMAYIHLREDVYAIVTYIIKEFKVNNSLLHINRLFSLI